MMILKGKYRDILFIFLVFIGLFYVVRIFQNYKFSEFLAHLPVEYQIGERLMVMPEGLYLTPAFRDLILKHHPGGIMIYGDNFRDKRQLYDLITDCQNLALSRKHPIPLLVATDQEGGWIAHLKEGFTVPPSLRALGRKNKRHYAYLAGRLIAAELKAAGVNVNFAPVLDLDLNRENRVIGPRSFGSDPHAVVELGSEFIKAHLKNGILPVIKHYPGLGRNKEDPHFSLLTNRADYRTLRQQDLKPFSELIKSYENGIMIGNVAVPAIVRHMEDEDRNNYRMFHFRPAFLSPIIVQKYLIRKNKYYGLIFSDELNIPVIRKIMPVEKAVFQALSSGVDIALVNGTPEKVAGIIRYLTARYRADPQFRRQTIVSVKKILKNKLVLFRKANRARYFSRKCYDIPFFKKDYGVLEAVNTERSRDLNRLLSLHTTEVFRDRGKLLPLGSRKEWMKRNFIVVSSKSSAYDECRKFVKSRLDFVKMAPYVKDEIPDSEISRVTGWVSPGSVVIMTILSRKYGKLIRAIREKNAHIVCINLLHAHNTGGLDEVDTVLNTYSDNDAQVRAAVEFLFTRPRADDAVILKEYREY